MMRALPALIRSLLLLALGGVALIARADIWGHVDERGVAHFASTRIDDRYQLFLKSTPQSTANGSAISTANSSANAPVPSLVSGLASSVATGQGQRQNIDTQISVISPIGASSRTSAGRGELLSPRLRAFFEQSPAVLRAEPLLRDAALRLNLDIALLKALVLAESGFDPQAVSPKGAIGLMQLMPATAQRYAFQGESLGVLAGRLTDPQLNIAIGARHLRELINRYEGRIELALAAYNAGEGAVQRAGDTIPAITETRNYVRQVMQVYEAMRAPTSTSTSAVLSSPTPTPTLAAAQSAPSFDAAVQRGDAIWGGALGRRNMPVPIGSGTGAAVVTRAGTALLPAVAVEVAREPATEIASEPAID